MRWLQAKSEVRTAPVKNGKAPGGGKVAHVASRRCCWTRVEIWKSASDCLQLVTMRQKESADADT